MARNRDKYRHGATLKRCKLDRAIEQWYAEWIKEIRYRLDRCGDGLDIGLSC